MRNTINSLTAISNVKVSCVVVCYQWCPPCMRLLPEFRKASKQMNRVHFGTVDCTIHVGLCQQYNIGSYPTTIFYNQSVPHHYRGHHTANGLVEFMQVRSLCYNVVYTVMAYSLYRYFTQYRALDQSFAFFCSLCSIP